MGGRASARARALVERERPPSDLHGIGRVEIGTRRMREEGVGSGDGHGRCVRGRMRCVFLFTRQNEGEGRLVVRVV